MRQMLFSTWAMIGLTGISVWACSDNASEAPPVAGNSGTSAAGAAPIAGNSGTGASLAGSAGAGTAGSAAHAGTSGIPGSIGTAGNAGHTQTGGNGPSSGSAGTGSSAGSGGASGSPPVPTGTELLTTETFTTGLLTPETQFGFKGALYTYGDNVSCTLVTGNPCSSGGCCVSGATVVDKTFAAWGCGVGMSLNATTEEPAVKSPYAGSIQGFVLTITGTGGPFRIGLTQLADTEGKVSPYYQVPGAGTYVVNLSDFVYPSWCKGNAGCDGFEGKKADLATAYDLQVQVPGGDKAASFDYCITSVKAF